MSSARETALVAAKEGSIAREPARGSKCRTAKRAAAAVTIKQAAEPPVQVAVKATLTRETAPIKETQARLLLKKPQHPQSNTGN